MSVSSRRTALVALTAPVLLLMSACGTGSDDPTLSRLGAPAAPATPAATAGTRTVTAPEALALARRPGAVVLDVRTPQEYADGHLADARNIALGDGFAAAVGDLPRDGAYVLYCASGNRSAQASSIMSGLGFADVADAGGLNQLVDAGGRLVT